MNDINEKLTHLRNRLHAEQAVERKTSAENNKPLPVKVGEAAIESYSKEQKVKRPNFRFQVSSSTGRVLRTIERSVWLDIHRFQPPLPNQVDDGEDNGSNLPSSANSENIVETAEVDTDKVDEAPANNHDINGNDENSDSATEESNPDIADDFISTYGQSFLNKFQLESYYIDQIEGDDEFINCTNSEKHLLLIIKREIDYINDNSAILDISLTSLSKIKKAYKALSIGRSQEALTIFKSVNKSNKNDRTIPFIISQILYFKAHNGSAESLPEARGFSKNACLHDERLSPQMVLNHRYLTATAERLFSAKRCAELMRNFYLINPESITSGEGLASHQSIHLKSWILLATIPMQYWNKFEIDSLRELASKVCGGALLYLYFFKDITEVEIEKRPDIFEDFRKVELSLHKSFKYYGNIIEKISTLVDDNGHIRMPTPLPWTLYNRYLFTFLKTAPLPTFDEILMNVSLDGRRFESDNYPNYAIKDAGLHHTLYWHTWIVSILANDEERIRTRIPIRKVNMESDIIREYHGVLEQLSRKEESLIDHERWEIIEPYMPNYSIKTLLELGSDTPGLTFGPDDLYFRAYYREWMRDSHTSKRMSDVVKFHAVNGGFSDATEVQMAIDGISRAIEDPVHGVKAKCKGAWLQHKAKQMLQERAESASQTSPLILHIKEYWWMYFLVLPMAFVTFISIISAGSYESALKTLFGLMAGFVVGGFLLLKLIGGGDNS